MIKSITYSWKILAHMKSSVDGGSAGERSIELFPEKRLLHESRRGRMKVFHWLSPPRVAREIHDDRSLEKWSSDTEDKWISWRKCWSAWCISDRTYDYTATLWKYRMPQNKSDTSWNRCRGLAARHGQPYYRLKNKWKIISQTTILAVGPYNYSPNEMISQARSLNILNIELLTVTCHIFNQSLFVFLV